MRSAQITESVNSAMYVLSEGGEDLYRTPCSVA